MVSGIFSLLSKVDVESVIMLTRVWMIMTCVWVLSVMDVTQHDNDVFIAVRFGQTIYIYNLSFTEAMFDDFYSCLCEGRSICQAKYNESDLFQVIEIVSQGSADTSTKNPRFYSCQLTEYYPGIKCTRAGLSVDTSEVAKPTVFMFSKPVSKCNQRCVGVIWTYNDEGIHFSKDIQPFIQTCDIDCICSALTSSSPFSPTSSSELSSTSLPKLSATSSSELFATSSSELSGTSPSELFATSSSELSGTSSSELFATSSSELSGTSPSELFATSSSASSSSGSSVAKTSQVSQESTTIFLTGQRHVPTDTHSSNTILTSASSHKPVEPTAHTSKAKDDDDKETPIGIIVGAVAGVIIVAVIIIVIVVVWKRRNREPKSSSKTDSRSTSSGHTEEQNNKRTQGREPHYVNTTPSNRYQNTKVTNERNVGNGPDNTIMQQDDNEDNDEDFGYYTTHAVSSGNNDGINNKTVSAKDNAGNHQNRISDDYGYSCAEDQSSGNNVTKPNKNGPSVVVTVNQNINIKSSGDDYEDVYTGDEIPSTEIKDRSKKATDSGTSPSRIPQSNTKEPEEEYAVVNKSRSVAKGDTASESKDVYSKLHETERHITNPYDSLHHLNASSNAENQADSTHALQSANQSSPYELAQPIPGTSANENNTEAFELVPVATSRKQSDDPKEDQKNVSLQGKKQAKKLPYGPEDYAVVIKNKPNDKNKAASFELGNK